MSSKKAPISKNNHRPKGQTEVDGVFFLKLLLYLLIGSFWLKLSFSAGSVQIALPIGLVIGLAFTFHEKLQINRKIEYAVLLVAMLVGYLAPYGIYLNFG